MIIEQLDNFYYPTLLNQIEEKCEKLEYIKREKNTIKHQLHF